MAAPSAAVTLAAGIYPDIASRVIAAAVGPRAGLTCRGQLITVTGVGPARLRLALLIVAMRRSCAAAVLYRLGGHGPQPLSQLVLDRWSGRVLEREYATALRRQLGGRQLAGRAVWS